MEGNKNYKISILKPTLFVYLVSAVIPLSHSLVTIPLILLAFYLILNKINLNSVFIFGSLFYLLSSITGLLKGSTTEHLVTGEGILIFSTIPLLLPGMNLTEKEKRKSLLLMGWIATIPVILGLIQAGTGIQYPLPRQPISSEGFFYGFFTHHNQSGGFYSAMSILFLYILIQEKKYILLIPLFFLFIGMALSLSRSAYISFTLCILLSFIIYSGKKGIKYSLPVLLGIVLLLFLIPSARERFSELKKGSSIGVRTYHWELALKTFTKNPIFGTGFGRLGEVIIKETLPEILKNGWKYPFPPISRENTPPEHLHNTYLTLLSKTGIAGFTIFSVMWFLILKRAWGKGLYAEFFSLISILILSLFDHNLRSFQFSTFVYLLAGLSL